MTTKAYDFAADVDRQIESLENGEYLQKLGRSKRLREELYPLSRLGLNFKLPGTEVFIEAFEDSGIADGSIKVTGFVEREFDVQITFAGYGYEDALRDEMLAKQGSAPGAGPIFRDKQTKEIVAETAAQNYDENVTRISTAIIERISDKVLKSYPEGTILLVAFEDENLGGLYWWRKLFAALELTDKTPCPFAQIFLFNGRTGELHSYRKAD